jgi:hypothetical protein
MRKVQLYINDQRIDLFDDETISLTQTIKNIQDVSKIFTDFSRSFTVPASKTNNKIFEHYYNFNIFDGFDSRTKAPAKIDINDVPFRFGRVRLDGVEMRSGKAYAYKITFYGNTVVLKDLMGEENLSALSTLDQFNETYDADSIEAALKADPSTEHIVAPLITHSQRLYYDSNEDIVETGNLHKGSNQHGVSWKQLKYAIRVHKIVEAIAERYGFTFSDDFFSTTNLPYYNLFMWLHRNKGPVTSIDQNQLYTKLITGWSTTQGTNSFITSNTLFLQDASAITNLRFDLDISGAITSPYSISITRDGQEIFAQSGIATASYDVDLLYAAQSGASYQVTISYSDAITFADAIWTIVAGIDEDEYSTGSFTAAASFEFVITDQIPEIKVIDFLSGLFKMFNLVAEVGNDSVITVKTLDDYYDEGNLVNITPFIHIDTHNVDSTIPYREISFSYEDTKSFLAANHNKLVGSDWGKESYNGEQQGIKEGEKFAVVVPFSHFKYENLLDIFGADTVEVQWGYAVDDNEDPYIGKPLLFYPILQSQNGIAFVDEVTAAGNFSNTIEITADIVMPSNSLYFDSATGTDNINFKFEKNEYTRDLSFPGTLFNNYYFNYIAALFNRQRRMSRFKAQLPVSFLLNYSLADTLFISDREYHINSITTNLITGESELELLNLVEGFLEIPENGNGGGEEPATLTVIVSGQTSPLESTQYTYNATVGGTAEGTPTYLWEVTNGTINGGNTSSNVAVTWNAVSANSPGSVKCTVTKGNLAPVSNTLNVTIQNTEDPTFTIDITGVDSPYTEGDTDTYGVDVTGDTTNVTYSWSVSGGTITSGQGTSSVNVTWTTPTTSGSIQVNAFRDGTTFLASDSKSVVVNAASAPTFGIDITNVSSPVLEDSVVTYGTTLSGTATGTVSYNWTVVGGSFINQGTSSITVTWSTPGAGSVRVDAIRQGVGASDQDSITVTALVTTVDITGDFTDIQRYLSRTYGSTVGGNTTGTITYSWSVSGGTINSGQGTSSVNVTWDTVGTGTLSLTATRQGRSGSDSGSLTVLPLYYRFERCSDELLVWQNLVSEPALDDLYTDGVNEYVYIGPPTSFPGTIVTNLSGPIGSGCTPPPPPVSSISITGDQDINPAGESGVTYTITTDPQTVSWLLSDAALSGFNPIDITITTSTSGDGNGTFNVTFGAYNGDGTETLRSVITATEQNPAFGNPAASGSIVISQSPPPPTYYIFDGCLVASGTVMQTFASAPSSNERAVDASLNYYTYTGATTTNASLHPIVNLTLQGVTGCPPEILSWLSERDDGGAVAYITINQSYSEGQSVLVNDGSGICWVLGTESTNSPQYSITSLCNTTTTTTTTTTTAAPSCNAVDISNETYGTLSAACSGTTTVNRDRTDGSPSNPQVGDIVYENAGCSILKPAGIYKNITAGAAIEIGSGGLITDVQFC